MLFEPKGTYPTTGTNKYQFEVRGSSTTDAIDKLKSLAGKHDFTVLTRNTNPCTRIASMTGTTPRYENYYLCLGEGYFNSLEAETKARDGQLVYDGPPKEEGRSGPS